MYRRRAPLSPVDLGGVMAAAAVTVRFAQLSNPGLAQPLEEAKGRCSSRRISAGALQKRLESANQLVLASHLWGHGKDRLFLDVNDRHRSSWVPAVLTGREA